MGNTKEKQIMDKTKQCACKARACNCCPVPAAESMRYARLMLEERVSHCAYAKLEPSSLVSAAVKYLKRSSSHRQDKQAEKRESLEHAKLEPAIVVPAAVLLLARPGTKNNPDSAHAKLRSCH